MWYDGLFIWLYARTSYGYQLVDTGIVMKKTRIEMLKAKRRKEAYWLLVFSLSWIASGYYHYQKDGTAFIRPFSFFFFSIFFLIWLIRRMEYGKKMYLVRLLGKHDEPADDAEDS